MKKIRTALSISLDREILLRAIKVAVVVGILLNLINQGEHIISLSFGSIHILKFILTFIVPYLVSTYTAVAFYMKFNPGTLSKSPAKLRCKNCSNSEIKIKESDLIPECENCGAETDWRVV